MQNNVDLFKGLTNEDFFKDPLSEEVWAETYKYHTDKTVWDTFSRVAGALASVEDTDEKRAEWKLKFQEMLAGYGSPGGRILANAGTDLDGVTLINCFVGPRVPHDQDSLEGILNHLLKQAQTLKSEGGWGENMCFKFDQPLYVKRNGEIKKVRIDEVVSGDLVQGEDGSWNLVEETLTSTKNNMVQLTLDSGEEFTCTIDHPFLVVRDGVKQYVQAGDLKETDELVRVVER